MDAADESTAFLAQAEASNVGELTIEQMHADVRRIAATYLKVPTLPLFTRTRALRDRAFTLLDGRQSPANARELWAAAGWSFTCRVERAEGFWSDAALALGDPAVTSDHADRAIARFEATPDEHRNLGSERMARLQQVRARLVLGQLDGAADALAPVLATSPEHRVRPLLHRLAEVSAATARYANEPITQEMHGAIDEFARHPVVADLTA